MLPLALGTGPGAEERRSVAVVVISGQMLSLLLTLLVTPVAYSIFDDAAALKPVRAVTERLGKLGTLFGRRSKPAREREGEAGD
jgi:HAE1 family hydrophobic/amphiphilic exporter-1